MALPAEGVKFNPQRFQLKSLGGRGDGGGQRERLQPETLEIQVWLPWTKDMTGYGSFVCFGKPPQPPRERGPLVVIQRKQEKHQLHMPRLASLCAATACVSGITKRIPRRDQIVCWLRETESGVVVQAPD